MHITKKRRFWKTLVTALMITTLTLGYLTPVTSVYAGIKTYPALNDGDTDEKSVTPWYQWNQDVLPWADDALGTSGQSGSLGAYGCWLTSFAMIGAMAKIEKTPDGKNWTPSTVNKYAADNGAFSGMYWTNNIPNVTTGGEIKVVSDGAFKFNEIQSKLQEGYYAMIFSGSHMVACYRSNGDKIYILDPDSAQYNGGKPRMQYITSSGAMYAEDGTYLYQHAFAQVLILQSSKVKSTESLTVDDAWSQASGDSGSSKEETKTDSATSVSSAFTYSEDLLPNMPKNRDYGKELKGSDDWNRTIAEYQKRTNVDFVKGSDAAVSIAKWKEERETNIAKSTITGMRRALMVIGVGIFMVATLFTVIYIVDRWNFFGVSILAIVSGGRVRLTYSEDSLKSEVKNGKKIRLISDYNVFGWVAFFSLVGLSLVSGLLYQVMSSFVDIIVTILGYFGK